MVTEATIAEFRRLSKIHEDWLVYALVGSSLLTRSELEAVHMLGLPPVIPLDLPLVSYLLGKKSAHVQTSQYATLTSDDLTSLLTPLELASVTSLRIKAAQEIRQVAQYVSGALQDQLCSALTQGITEAANGFDVRGCIETCLSRITDLTFSKSFTLFENMYHMAVSDLVHVSKSSAVLNSMIQCEGVYTEGLDSQVFIENQGSYVPLTARDLVGKSLSGSELFYAPPGSTMVEGRLHVLDDAAFQTALAKAISAVNKPPGPPQPAASSTPKPGSIPGVPAPGNKPGPGAGNTASAPKSGTEYDQWLPPGSARPPGAGWEQSKSGGWRHIKGAGSSSAAAAETPEERMVAEQMHAQHWGLTPKPPQEVTNHLSMGTISSLKELGDNEAGINTAFRITIEGNGRGLMKPQPEPFDMDLDSKLIGSGLGSVQRGHEHQHEEAAYKLATALGSDVVPPTVTRAYGGEQHSVQAWSENHDSVGVWVANRASKEEWDEAKNKTELLISQVPAHAREAFVEKLHGMIVKDIVMNNNDRHTDNIVVNATGDDFKAIDHGLSFGTGMKGVRNDFHHQLAQLGKKVTIPQTLKTRLQTMSLGDYKRALGSNVQDWEIGQTYLRGKYALHLQETEGHLDPAKFLPTMDSVTGTNEMPFSYTGSSGGLECHPAWRVNNSSQAGFEEFMRRQDAKTLPNDLFNSWAKKYINDHKDNPESPDHKVAQELDRIGVFMPGSSTVDTKAFRRTGGHREYEKTIEARNPDAKVGHRKPLETPTTGVDPYASTVVSEGPTGLDRRAEVGTVARTRKSRKQKTNA